MEQRDALITGLVIAAVCALITVFVVIGRGPADEVSLRNTTSDTPPSDLDDDDAGGDTSDEGGDDEAPSGDVAAELDAFVDEAIAFVEATRGRAFLEDPVVLALADDDFVARVDADLAEQFDEVPEEVEMFNHFYRALALIGPDESIDEVYRSFGAAGILGFYDPTTDELVVRRPDELSLLTKSTIVHELTHAFDDQHFDLDRPEYDERTDEIPWTFSATVEGSASWVEAEWEASLSAPEQAALLAEELGFGGGTSFDDFEIAFLLNELSIYQYGEVFVERLVREQGIEALDAVIVEPPSTSEQIIEREAFDSGEGALGLDPPTADGPIEIDGVGGQSLIDALFQGNFIRDDIAWGADYLVVWDTGDASCVRWDIRADDQQGAQALQSGFQQWAGIVGNGEVTVLDPTTIRVDRCS